MPGKANTTVVLLRLDAKNGGAVDRRLVGLVVVLAGLVAGAPDMTAHADGYGDAATAAGAALVARHGEAERARITRGLTQVQRAWRADDGDPAAFRAFVEAEFLPQGPALDAAFARLESAFESVDGYFNALGRDLRRGLDLAIGPELPIDARLGAWDPSSHVTDDLFSTRVAFVVLLNFPRSTLAEPSRSRSIVNGDSPRRITETPAVTRTTPITIMKEL